MPQPLYPRGKSPRYPSVRRLGGAQSRSGRGEEKNLCLCRDSNPGRPACCSVTIVTQLSRLHMEHIPGCFVLRYWSSEQKFSGSRPLGSSTGFSSPLPLIKSKVCVCGGMPNPNCRSHPTWAHSADRRPLFIWIR